MLANAIRIEAAWDSLQEPRCPSDFPASYLLLLSALDDGWRITRIEVRPSWDHSGSVYLLTLKHRAHLHRQELILPKNTQVQNLLAEYRPVLKVDRLHFPFRI